VQNDGTEKQRSVTFLWEKIIPARGRLSLSLPACTLLDASENRLPNAEVFIFRKKKKYIYIYIYN
jgi:hypothetical protein